MPANHSPQGPPRPRARLIVAALVGACLAAGAWAQDSPSEQPPVEASSSLQERFDALSAEYMAAEEAFWQAYAAADAAGEEPDMGALPLEAFLPRFEELADAGLPDALFWLLLNKPFDQPGDYAQALERALQSDPDNEAIGGILIYLHYSVSGDAAAELAVLDRYVQTEGAAFARTAEYAKAMILARDESDSERVEQAVEILERLSTLSVDFPGRKSVAGALFGLQHLRLGMLAPDFETTDVDGSSFKLSDYRGKVTVVEFWGFW